MPNRPRPRRAKHNFNTPANTSGNGNGLTVGPGLCLYWDLQPANIWTDHDHLETQLVIAFDPVLSSMTWERVGGVQTVSCQMPHIWIVPPKTIHRAEWKNTSAMLVLYVEKSFLLEECGGEPTEGAVLDLEVVCFSDILIKHVRPT